MRKKRGHEDRPVYLISIVSEMLGVHPQTLRAYEREGFIAPRRGVRETPGGQRLYSASDVERLEFILRLTRELGVNRAGVEVILRLRQRLDLLQSEVESLMEQLESEEREEFRRKIRRIFEEA
jgi:MerR family transcriptional regulator/heat shock protein HspR